MRPQNLLLHSLLMLVALSAFPISAYADDAVTMRISSPAIADGATIPVQFTCSGIDQSPPLTWTDVPPETKSLALLVEDPDAPSGTFIHWVVYDIPPTMGGLNQGKASRPFPGGGEEGMNGFGKMGYKGPCPPPGKPHHYHFKLFALDKNLNLGLEPDAQSVRDAMQGHVKASAEFVGIFSR